MKTRLIFLLPLLWLLIGCEDSEPESKPDSTDPPLIEYHYELPVVFHVLYQNEQQNIKKGRIQEIITACNKYYQNRLGSNSVDMNLEFVLATENPQGVKLDEPGVHPIQVSNPVQDCEVFMTDKANLKYLWDTDKYINIMLYPFKQDENSEGVILGISHLPYTIKPDYLEGLNQLNGIPSHSSLKYPHCISINNTYINSTPSNESKKIYSSTDIVATIAHELAHYLGLFHTFSESDDEGLNTCMDTDYCDDTPTYEREAYSNWMQSYIESKNGIKNMSLSEFNKLFERKDCVTNLTSTPNNIMDYDISWVNRFTPNQQERIRYVLMHSPLVPGPKVERTTTRTLSGEQELPMKMIK